MDAPRCPAYRQFFSHARMVQDLLLAFVREDWVAEPDFTPPGAGQQPVHRQ